MAGGVATSTELFIRAAMREISDNFKELAEQSAQIASAAELLTSTIRAGGKVIFCGNGGSAADSQHLAAELMGRYLKDRRPLPALALTVDTSAITAIGNDYTYDEIFARQFRGIGRRDDALVAISTSGNSRNVLEAANAAREIGAAVVGMTGASGGRLHELCDICIKVPATSTNRIQEMHIAVGHTLCGLVEDALC